MSKSQLQGFVYYYYYYFTIIYLALRKFAMDSHDTISNCVTVINKQRLKMKFVL